MWLNKCHLTSFIPTRNKCWKARELMRELKYQSESRKVNQSLIWLQYLGAKIINISPLMPFLSKKDIWFSFYLHTCHENLAHRSQSNGRELHFLAVQLFTNFCQNSTEGKGRWHNLDYALPPACSLYAFFSSMKVFWFLLPESFLFCYQWWINNSSPDFYRSSLDVNRSKICSSYPY